MRNEVRRCILGFVLVLFGPFACREKAATQVLVVLDAEESLKSRIAKVDVRITNDEGEVEVRELSFSESPVGIDDFPIRVPLVPKNGDPGRRYEVSADALDSEELLITRVRAFGGYVQDELREIGLRFSERCEGVICGPGLTCQDGVCSDACFSPALTGEPALARPCPGSPEPDAGIPPTNLDDTVCDDALLSGALFCDGFETQDTSAWDSVGQQLGLVEVVSSPSYRGRAALRCALEPSTGSQRGLFVKTNVLERAGVRSGALYARAYFYLPSGDEIQRINLAYLGQNAAPRDGFQIGLKDVDRVFAFVLPEDQEFEAASSSSVLRDRWFCFEFGLNFSASDGGVQIWIDNTLVLEQSNLNAELRQGVLILNMGIALAKSEQQELVLQMDEVVVSRQRIGCDE